MTDRHVLIDLRTVEMIEAASKSCHNQPESGGILLGKLLGPTLECVGFTLPGPKDVRQMHRFIRQDPIHQETARRAWENSGHTVTFLGEWHTHPYGPAEPSSIDTGNWRELTRHAKHPMVFAIASPEGWNAFMVSRRCFRHRVKLLSLAEQGISSYVFL